MFVCEKQQRFRLGKNDLVTEFNALVSGVRAEPSKTLLKIWKQAQKVRQVLSSVSSTSEENPIDPIVAASEVMVRRARFLFQLSPMTHPKLTESLWGYLKKVSTSELVLEKSKPLVTGTPKAKAPRPTMANTVSAAMSKSSRDMLRAWRRRKQKEELEENSPVETVLKFVQSDVSIADMQVYCIREKKEKVLGGICI